LSRITHEFDLMKRGLIVLILALPVWVFSQSSNNWINFSQSYYKIPVAKDGVYRLTYSDLNDAGFPVSAVDPRFIQIIHRGVEQAIYFKHNQIPADSKFDATEYLEFYGQRNDGTLDAKLYEPLFSQPHPYYNLYSDTSAYFLTWNVLPVQGKRMANFSEVNISFSKEGSQTSEHLEVYSNDYSGGETLADLISYSYFNNGEGWTGSTICSGSSGCTGFMDIVISNLSGVVTTTANPQIEIQLSGREDLSHSAEIYVGPNASALTLIASPTFINFETPTITSAIDWSAIGSDGKMTVRVKALGVGGQRDRLSISYVKVNFAQNFDMTGLTEKRLGLSSNTANGKSYIELINAPAGLRVWDITDINNIVNIGTYAVNGTTTGAIVPNTTEPRTLFTSSQFLTPKVKPVSFRQINPSLSDYLIVSHRSLMAPGLGYGNAVEAYATYRASDEGGGYDTLTIAIDQLYNQFNYGETSSLAIYEFMKYMHAGGNPKYLFLIGKGREVWSSFYRKTTLASGELADLVPVGGVPASDMVFTAQLGGTAHVAAIPTGRITASNPAQVAAYLNKVKETESSAFNELWHKQVLHLSGGIQPFELNLFRQYMDGFASVAEGDFYGASVKTLGKHEATAIELVNISEEINKGVNMVTFFGHSAPNVTDIDIGYVSDPAQGYNNPGKYPAFLVNGCNAGEFFASTSTFGEDWILTANKGARNFIANSSYGYSTDLQRYSEIFYQKGFADSAGIRSGIGNVQIEVAKKYLEVSSADITSVAVTQQMILLGDPAVKLFGPVKPDFEISDTDISIVGFDNKPVTALADSFALKLIVKSLGVATKDSLAIQVLRKFTDNTSSTYDSVFAQPFNQDTIIFVIRQSRVKGYGINSFTVILDPDNSIDEFNEENNEGTFGLTIPLSGTKNLFPAPYSIVSKKESQLVFQNTNVLSDIRSYLVEVDTTDSFDSPAIQKFSVNGKVLLKQKVQLLSADSTVYHWRTKLADPSGDENPDWQLSSFAYIADSPEGWTQMRFSQFNEDVVSGLVKDSVLHHFEFVETATSVFLKTFGKDNPASANDVAFNINGVDYWHSLSDEACRSNTINMVAFNKNTVVPYEGIPFTFQNANGRACGREPQLINSFLTGETDTGLGDDLIQYVDNIHTGDSVLLFTLGDAGLDLWTSNVKNKLGEFGISVAQIDGILSGEPIVILGRKGATPGTAKIIQTTLTPESEQELVFNETITGKLASGSIQSTLIGPANAWKKFSSRASGKTASDEVRFDLYGIKLNGEEELIQSNIGNDLDLSAVSASIYPQLKLVYFTKDETDLTAAQLRKWFVFFVPVAEGMLLYNGSADQQTVKEGQSWTGNYFFTNISERSFADSLNVDIEFFNEAALTVERKVMKIQAPIPGDSTAFQISSTPKKGLNDVNVFVNRRILPEVYYENNTIELIGYLNVLPDYTAPVLDVTIDGRHMENGDYTSPNPSILISLKDENPFLFKTDTSGIDVLLKYPCESSDCNFKRINLSGNEIKWNPESATSDFKIEFNPKELPDGEYTLSVQAQDVAGNKAGEDPYQVNFNVQRETSVLFTPAFPNPSSSDFFFRFVLKGQYELDQFRLQIWSSAGKLIHTFTEANLNQFYIGIHELTWNGQDESGGAIQPGIYIYRMEVGANGNHSTTHGKLVFIR
jgi:hypothetical protein